MTNVISGRDNLALTVFVPYDCNKNCFFCTTKKLYNKNNVSIEDICIKLMQVLNINAPIKDVVISGGEPLSNLTSLWKLLSVIPKEYKVYVNTSFPKISDDNLTLFNKILNRIDGLNVSRHIEHNYDEFTILDTIKSLVGFKTKVRINVFLKDHISAKNIYEDTDMTKYLRKIMSYAYFDIQLRGNYIDTTLITNKKTKNNFSLFDDNDKTSEFIKSFNISPYKSGCMVCSSITVPYLKTNFISFHKGVTKTSVVMNGVTTVNDLIIYPDGTLRIDWDGDIIDVEELHFNEKVNISKNKTTSICSMTKSSC